MAFLGSGMDLPSGGQSPSSHKLASRTLMHHDKRWTDLELHSGMVTVQGGRLPFSAARRRGAGVLTPLRLHPRGQSPTSVFLGTYQ